MDSDERPGWRRYLRDALRPEAKPARPTRRAVRADAALAVVLTVVALIVAARYPGDGPFHVGPRVGGPGDVRPPLPPVAPGVVLAEDQAPTAPWPVVVLSALPLAARRRYPMAVFGIVTAAVLGLGAAASWINVLTCVVAAYSVVRYGRHQLGAITALVAAALLAGVALRDADPMLPGWSGPAVVLLVAGVLAGLARLWRRQLAAGRDRYARLQRAQQEATRRAVAEERARIAAELHDVVTHNVSVMVIQAGAARTVMDAAPERSKEALLAVEAGGRAAMAELRHVMSLLAGPEPGRPDGLEPAPGLARLDALIERVRAAGTPVDVTVSLPPEPLPPGVDLAAYRVVQEALTNTLKHAPGAAATVAVRHDDDRLEVEVTDTGGSREASPAGGNGRGLIGLRERIAVYEGELTSGPTLAGGWRVRARIPRRPA